MKYNPIHVIPKVEEPSPAFIHIDVDDLWAIAECYGYTVAEEFAHQISLSALPLFAQLFEELDIHATFFLVGRDLEFEPYRVLVRTLLAAGHQVANHSLSHSLRFRALGAHEMAAEIDGGATAIKNALNIVPVGFRAPGYGWSPGLVSALEQRGYKYDASLMPSPYGSVFRWMDRRLQKPGSSPIHKTQYPLLSDTWHSIYPALSPSGQLVEIPSATSSLLRLPFQAGVCMRLGYPYFRACFQPYRYNRALPFVFLFHAADLADFRGVPGKLFETSSFFTTPVEHRLSLARRFLQVIKKHRPIITTEKWLSVNS